MKIGELFVEITAKGADVTRRSLGAVGSSLKEATHLSLETKAALIGVFYEFNKFVSQSAHAGLALQQFSNLTGLNGEALQKWQFALQQSGVSADETLSTFTRLQGVMNDIILNGNIPQGFKVIAESVHLDPTRLRDTFYVFDKLREYAQTHKNAPDMTRALLAPTIGSDNVIQALMTGTFDPTKTPGNQMYSKGQTKALAAVQIGLTNLRTKVEHEFGKFTAKWGPSAIKDLDKLSDSVFKLADAFAALLEKLHAVEIVNSIFEGWREIFNSSAEFVDTVTKSQESGKGLSSVFGNAESWKIFFKDLVGIKTPMPVSPTSHAHSLHQTINIHGMNKPHEAGQEVRRETNKAFRALQTGQAN